MTSLVEASPLGLSGLEGLSRSVVSVPLASRSSPHLDAFDSSGLTREREGHGISMQP